MREFKITIKDIEKLQKGLDYCLTDNNEPLDLFCVAYDLWTENQCLENSHDWTSEQESYIIDNNLDFDKSFLKTLDKTQKNKYMENTEQYTKDLEYFIEQAKEYFYINYEFEDKELQEIFDNWKSGVYHDFHKEYLYWDYQNDWIISLIKNALPDYDYNFGYSEDWTITIWQENWEDYTTKTDFLYMLKYKAKFNLDEKQKKREQNNIDRKDKEQRAIEHKEREKQQIIKKLQA